MGSEQVLSSGTAAGRRTISPAFLSPQESPR
jgi:hypothetical protein